jgi:hypothetical protein
MLVEENVSSLKYFLDDEECRFDSVKKIPAFIEEVLRKLPWFYRIPFKITASIVALLSYLVAGRPANRLSAERRAKVLSVAEKIPLYGMFNKLVRAMTLLTFFDVCPRKTT